MRLSERQAAKQEMKNTRAAQTHTNCHKITHTLNRSAAFLWSEERIVVDVAVRDCLLQNSPDIIQMRSCVRWHTSKKKKYRVEKKSKKKIFKKKKSVKKWVT